MEYDAKQDRRGTAQRTHRQLLELIKGVLEMQIALMDLLAKGDMTLARASLEKSMRTVSPLAELWAVEALREEGVVGITPKTVYQRIDQLMRERYQTLVNPDNGDRPRIKP